MDEIRTDLCVIGAGSGGLSVAAGAVQMGARVVLIEAAEMGGDCLNHGCVPSKALIAAAKAAHAMTAGARFGIRPVAPRVDFAAVKDHVAQVIAAIAPVDSQERFEGLGVRVIRAHARFVAPDVVEAGGQRIRARRFVIATGSRPRLPPIPGLTDGPYLTNETIFPLREKPEHLLILGAGPIGFELAQAHRRLGCRVTVVDAGTALQRDDPELAAVVLTALGAEGVEIVTEAKVGSVDWSDGVALRLEDGRILRGSHLLVATGRAVSFEGMDLDAAKIAHDNRGVTVDARLRSSNRRVFAVGDAAGQGQFTHLAGYHAGIVIRQAVLGLPARVRTDHIPRVTYADPELAQVGLTEAEARKTHGDRVEVLRWSFHDNDRAQAEHRTEGLVKLVAVRGKVVGAGIVGAQAGELISLWALVVSSRIKLSAVAGMVLPYPTLSEVSKRAAGAYFSPKLFDNPALRQVVRLVQRVLP